MATDEIVAMPAKAFSDEMSTSDSPTTGLSPIQLREWNSTNSPFLSRLPPEIRNQIYDLALIKSHRVSNLHLITRYLLSKRSNRTVLQSFMLTARANAILYASSAYKQDFQEHGSGLAPPLLQTCHQIALETRSLFYSTKRVSILSGFSPQPLEQLKELCVLIWQRAEFYPRLEILEVTDIRQPWETTRILQLLRGTRLADIITTVVLSLNISSLQKRDDIIRQVCESECFEGFDSIVVRAWNEVKCNNEIIGGYGMQVEACGSCVT